MFDAPLLLFISFGHFILLTVVTRVRALHSSMLGCIGAMYASEKSLGKERSITGAKSEPGPAASHETALKEFLSVSELTLDREARSAISFV
jgi:hypothetical protein